MLNFDGDPLALRRGRVALRAALKEFIRSLEYPSVPSAFVQWEWKCPHCGVTGVVRSHRGIKNPVYKVQRRHRRLSPSCRFRQDDVRMRLVGAVPSLADEFWRRLVPCRPDAPRASR